MNIRMSDDGKGMIINGRYCKFCEPDKKRNQEKEWWNWYRM